MPKPESSFVPRGVISPPSFERAISFRLINAYVVARPELFQ